MADEKRRPTPTMIVDFSCACGKEWQQKVVHYDIIRCACGRFVWALQPKRNGPLKGYQWPGDPAMLRNRDRL